MLPRSRRLQQRKVFDPLYRFGHMHRGKMLTVRCISTARTGLIPPANRPAENLNVPSQITVIVSKKVSRKAVERNRIKRRVRNQLQLLLSSLVPDHYIAISANRPRGPVSADRPPVLLTCPTFAIYRELRELFERANLLQDCSRTPYS